MALATHAAYSALNQCDADDMRHKPLAWPPPLRVPSQLTATNCQSGLTKRGMQWRAMSLLQLFKSISGKWRLQR